MLAAAVLTALLALPTRRAACRAAAVAAASAWQRRGAAAASPSITIVPGSGTDGRTYGVTECGPSLPRAVVGSDPTLERVELALTLRSGYLQDPPSVDGLAHLCEHVTLAADPEDLNGFIDERVGTLNAFTAEETTTFHLEFDVDGDPRQEVRDVCRRFAALFISRPASVHVVRQELPRIHAEWDAFERSPARHSWLTCPPPCLRTAPISPLLRCLPVASVAATQDGTFSTFNQQARTALELAALKQRTDASNSWRRLGRGSARTMPLAEAGVL